ncbi:MAG TPA: FtsX-like permease family protein [Parasegetibacter sp.]
MIFRIAVKNLKHKPLSAILSWLLITLSGSLIIFLLLFQQQTEKQLNGNSKDIDMVLGAKGSPLQLVLSAVYHADYPTGNIPLKEAEKWMKHPLVKSAIPLAYGDSYKNFRIVGTTPAYAEHFGAELKEGKMFEKNFETVIGAEVARQTGLKIGDTFIGTHGEVADDGHTHDEHPYKVTGILNRTGTVVDRLLLCNIASVWAVHEEHDHSHNGHEQGDHDHHDHDGHDHGNHRHSHTESAHEHHGHDHSGHNHSEESHSHAEHNNENKEITAVIIRFTSPMAAFQLPNQINESSSFIAALPAIEVNRLFTLFGMGAEALKNIAWGLLILAGISLFITLIYSLNERKHELALMRSMGSKKSSLLQLVFIQSWILTIAGFISAIILGRFFFFLAISMLPGEYNTTTPDYTLPFLNEITILILMLVIAALAATVPAWKAYKLNISKTLADV